MIRISALILIIACCFQSFSAYADNHSNSFIPSIAFFDSEPAKNASDKQDTPDNNHLSTQWIDTTLFVIRQFFPISTITKIQVSYKERPPIRAPPIII